MNRVPGQPLYLKDINCRLLSTRTEDLLLNPAAWTAFTGRPMGRLGAILQRLSPAPPPRRATQPGPRFVELREGMTFSLRAEFFNVFNRLMLPNPSSGNPFVTTTRDAQGNLTQGFGWINPRSSGTPRNSQIVIRFQF